MDFGSRPSGTCRQRHAGPSDDGQARARQLPPIGDPEAADRRSCTIGCFGSHADRGREPVGVVEPSRLAGHQFGRAGQRELGRELNARARSRRTRRPIRSRPPRLTESVSRL
jgi:hypothetical protein